MNNSRPSSSAAAIAASTEGNEEKAGSTFASGGTPLNLLSLGAGVQSSTLALMAAAGEIGPMPDGAIFADTQAEPASVYRWLEWLTAQIPYPVYIVTEGSLTKAALTMKKTKDGRLYSKSDIPMFAKNADGSQGKIRMRACTRDFKLAPIFRECARIAGKRLVEWRKQEKEGIRAFNAWKRSTKAGNTPIAFPREAWDGMQARALVVQWIGISMDEIRRMKPSRSPWLRSRWPLIEREMTRHDCMRWMEEKGFPKPPRSACVYCPYHNDTEWRRLRDEEPHEFARAVQFERDLQAIKGKSSNFRTTPFLHRSLVPLDQVDFSTDADRGQLSFFDNECEGICGV